MPLYEYRCTACSHELEVLQKLSDPAPVECPVCHQPALQKKLSAAGFQLKGTGWYVTDFRGGNKPRADNAPKGGDESATAAPSGEAGADSAKSGTEGGAKSGTEVTTSAPAAGGSTAPATPSKPAVAPSAG